jgi:DNA-binding NarL/FixJ family response regulator
MTARRIRVLVVDDAADHARLCTILLGAEADMEVVGSLGTADLLVETAIRLEADVVLLDLRMPGRPPLEALRDLVKARPDSRVVVCSGFDGPEYIAQSRAAGAAGHFVKTLDITELVGLVRKVARGEAGF